MKEINCNNKDKKVKKRSRKNSIEIVKKNKEIERKTKLNMIRKQNNNNN